MKTLRTILRAFVLGAVAGLLVAPRSGRETREMIGERWNKLLDSGPGVNFDDTATPGDTGTTTGGPFA